MKRVENPINNLADAAYSAYDVGVIDSSNTYEVFRSSKYDVNRKIWHKIQAKGLLPNNSEQGVQWARDRDEFIFITDGPLLRYAVNKQPCDLMRVPGLTTAHGLAFALQTQDPKTMEFTLAMLHLGKTAFLDGLRRKWWENTNECPQETHKGLSQKRIDLASMWGVYIVLTSGIVAAFISLAAEHIVAYVKLRPPVDLRNNSSIQVLPRPDGVSIR